MPVVVVLAVLYACVRLLLDAMRTGRDHAADQAELLALRHQVRVLERQHGKPRWNRGDRLVLSALAQCLPRVRWGAFLVQPETLLSWHRNLVRRKWASYSRRPRRGRPAVAEEVRRLVVLLARENPGWGYLRIKGELRKLGHQLSASSIKRILRSCRMPPAPRRSSLTWAKFLRAQAATIVASDFFTANTVLLHPLYVIFFIHLESRRLLFAGCTRHPDSAWVTQQARNLAWELSECGLRPRFLIRDRDSKYSKTFDNVIQATGAEVLRTPVRCPRANAIAERWVRSVRREVLDWLLVIDERHLRRILEEYIEHYNSARPHRALGLSPPVVGNSTFPVGPVVRHERLGGLIHEYARVA